MAAPGKCFLVTGPPGVGKTTLITRVFESLKTSFPNLKIQGFYTREIRQGSKRVGFEVVTLDGRKGPLSSSTISSPESIRWPTVGKFKVDVAAFESLALPELQVKEDTDLFIIDEVGKMELFSSSFFPAVLRILESNIPLLASIPILKIGRDIPGDVSSSGILFHALLEITITCLEHNDIKRRNYRSSRKNLKYGKQPGSDNVQGLLKLKIFLASCLLRRTLKMKRWLFMQLLEKQLLRSR